MTSPTSNDSDTAGSLATPLKGAPVAKAIRAQVATAIEGAGVSPHLVNVVVGDDPASAAYLGAIDKAATKVGARSSRITLPADADTATVRAAVERAGADADVHGLMVQFPLPRGIDADAVTSAVPASKDVDGITDASLGRILAGRRVHTAPATAAAVVELLLADEATTPTGRHVVIIGRSLVVGRPLGAMLAAKGAGGDATVTLCHTRTKDVASHTRRADILVVAAGVRGLLTPDMVTSGAIVIDVGIHAVEGPDGKTTLAGDVDPGVAEVAGVLTPVPGGVGPVTNAILMRHVTAAACPDYLPPAW